MGCGHTTRYLWPLQLVFPAKLDPAPAQFASLANTGYCRGVRTHGKHKGFIGRAGGASAGLPSSLAHCSDLAVPPVSINSSSPLPCLYTRVFTSCFNALPSGVLSPWSTPSLHWQVKQRGSTVFLPNHLHVLSRQALLLLKPRGFNTALCKYY